MRTSSLSGRERPVPVRRSFLNLPNSFLVPAAKIQAIVKDIKEIAEEENRKRRSLDHQSSLSPFSYTPSPPAIEPLPYHNQYAINRSWKMESTVVSEEPMGEKDGDEKHRESSLNGLM